MTNYDRIKNMSIEEMHQFLCKINTDRMCYGEGLRGLPETKGLSYNDEIRVWLKSEVGKIKLENITIQQLFTKNLC